MNPVLIAGAGLSGLAAALTLTKNGVPVRIIERDPKFHYGQRGSALMPRTLEVYNFLGVLADCTKTGNHPFKRCIYEMPEGRKPMKIFEMFTYEDPTPSVPFRNCWIIGQAHNEEILRDHLAKHNVFVELSTELVDFDQDENGVIAHVIKHNGSEETSETIPAAFLIGADGARSTVRKKLGLSFTGETRDDERMFLADMEIKGLSRDYWHSWGDHSPRNIYLRPTEYDGLFSCLIYAPPKDLKAISDDRDALFKFIKDVTNRHELEFGNITWMSEWRANIRMANKFSEGRVFIVGDAAHIHAPHGAQGFNSGVQDSYNLAWKLALVWHGIAPRSLLDSYTDERLPVIKDMIHPGR
ncbi:hypothetical protein NM688_g9412 [Phlebia brevispora]|uniref:Uncharacterized protein n=1 Tax=Phlebia brevispora TaxID=194682 RepID=A0ACC1RHV8_9APHY|nr:hypothetical protein NM688_g9412 [Phlebia brevispora]